MGVTLLGGCAVGPDYKKPEIEVPDAWHETVLSEAAGKPTASIQTWWEIFNDPALNELIEEARSSNLNLQIALANVREARAQLAYAGGMELPSGGLFQETATTKLSDDGALHQIAPPGGFQSQGMMVFGLDAAYEIDVFGRISREVESESARFQASVEAYRDVLVSLYAEVALTYIQIRSFQAHIANAEQNIHVQQQSLELTQERFKDGLTSELDIDQAKSNLYTTKAAVPQYRIYLNDAFNRLAVLCGKDAGTLQLQVSAEPLPVPDMNISIGLPADLLRQRPDIREAERQIASSTALIGAAKAELFPRFALKGSIGLESRSVSTLFDSSSIIWTVAAPVHWNVFTMGRTFDMMDVREEQQIAAILEYRQVVLEALEETENAMVSYNEYRIRHGYLGHATVATQSAVKLVTVQYESGLTDFNNVLDMQRTLFDQQKKLIDSSTDSLRSIIALYKAVGGGWNAAEAGNYEAAAEDNTNGTPANNNKGQRGQTRS